MSIFKGQRRDDRTFWGWVRGLFGKKCKSYLADYKGSRRECNQRAGHKGKHTDGTGLWWGYGDNWLEGN
jgi:hypothetical protein